MTTPTNLNVTSESEAQEAIAKLLVSYASRAASERLSAEASWAKQSQTEIARRAAGNLLRSFQLHKNTEPYTDSTT